MTHPSQQFSRKGTHTKALAHKPREPKLTVEKLVNAIPEIGFITKQQLVRKTNCSGVYVCKVAEQAIEQGLIECFTVMGREKHFRRINETEGA